MSLTKNNPKVLVIGDEPSDFICPLFKKIGSRYKLDVSLFELRKNKPETLINESFKNNVTLETEIQAFDVLKSFFNPKFYNSFFQFFNLKKAIRIAFTEKKARLLFSQYDVFNFHLLSANALSFIEFIPPYKKIVLSFWGSDLLNPSPQFSPEMLQNAVKRADAITLHSIEMREIFLSKYGRNLFNKVHVTLLADETKELEKITNLLCKKEGIISDFKTKHNIPSKNTIVTIGHSGHDIDNHLEVIRNLSKLNENLKNNITLLFPMTYGCDDKRYFDTITKRCVENKLSLIIFKEFLSKEEIIELRIVSEVHIRVPIFDAFSLSLCETFCTDNIIIAGAWLPYSRLRFSNVYFHEIDYNNKLPNVMENILMNLQENREKHKGNHEKIITMFKKENSTEKFYKALKFDD